MFVNLSNGNEMICKIIKKKKLLENFLFFIDSQKLENHPLTEINKMAMELIIRLTLNISKQFPTFRKEKIC